MSNILNRMLVLQLNANWMPIGVMSVRKAIVAMNSDGDQPPAKALDIEYSLNDNGEYDYFNPVSIYPVGWDEWISKRVRGCDMKLSSARMDIRVPTVIIATDFKEMPIKHHKSTNNNIYLRDDDTCQYSGERLTKHSRTIDHVIPLSRGGKNTFDNLVCCKKEINHMKGNKLPSEAGLKLIRKPRELKPIPMSALILEAKHPTWLPFILKK